MMAQRTLKSPSPQCQRRQDLQQRQQRHQQQQRQQRQQLQRPVLHPLVRQRDELGLGVGEEDLEQLAHHEDGRGQQQLVRRPLVL